ncbi:MAG: PGF-CTERM sorting domain-containing protein [ANME-2 cluster archaeon]|nr:PGF-CTERM sorting domain-containing protein [ANME-2 cluster archaeon]
MANMNLTPAVKTVLVMALVLASVLAGGCLREYDTTSLQINKVDISAEVVDDDIVQLDIISYVSNSGKTSGEVDIQAKAYNLATSLLMADEKISMGKIGKDRTRNGTVELQVPITGNYRVEVTMYEDGGLVTSGKATISGLESLLSSPKHSYINIRDVDVTMTARGDTTTTLKVTTFLDNYGRSDSAPLTALVKLRDAKTNLIGKSGNINVGVVKADTTLVKDIELEVPKDRDYRVEIMIFENDRIITEYGVSFFMAPDSQGEEDVVKKTRSVSTTETITTEFIQPTPPEPYDYGVYRTGDYGVPMAGPGFGVFLGIAGLLAVALLLRKRK